VVRVEPEDFHHFLFNGSDGYVAISGFNYAGSSYSAVTTEHKVETFYDGVLSSFDRSEYWQFEIGGNAAVSGNLGVSIYDSANSVIQDIDSGVLVADGLEHDVSYSFDSGTVTFYVEGQSVYSTTIGSTFGSGNTRYGFVGVDSEASTYGGSIGSSYFQGKMAETRIWDDVRTQTEIDSNRNQSLSGDEANLQVYYRQDYISPKGNVPDYSTNGNDGERFGGVEVVMPNVALRGPFNKTETWEDHFIGTGTSSSPQFSTMQSLIDAGYSHYLQPGTPTTAYHEEIYDVGTVLDSTQISVSLSSQAIAGSPSLTTTIYVKETRADSWRSETGVQGFFNNVRFVKIRFDIDGSSDSDLMELADFSTTLAVQRLTEEGTAYADAADTGGTMVSLSKDFTVINSITATPKGDVNYATATDWTDPNPSSFDIVMYDSSGNRVSGDVSYTVRGV